MARRPSVRWSETAQRWMAWVRFPDGSRRKVERVDRGDAEADLEELLALRAQAQVPGARHQRLVTFNEVIDTWLEAGCPTPAPSQRRRHVRAKSENTRNKIRDLLDGHSRTPNTSQRRSPPNTIAIRPEIGTLRVDRTPTARIEDLFRAMDATYATSTIRHTWAYLNDACLYAGRHGKVEHNPAADVLLPEAKPPKPEVPRCMTRPRERLNCDPGARRGATHRWVSGTGFHKHGCPAVGQ